MDNCCLNMYVSGTIGSEAPVFEWTSPITGAYPSFSFEVEVDTLSLVFNEETSEWQIFAGDVFVGSSTYEGNNECPSGLNIVNEGDITYSYTVYSVPCGEPYDIPTIEYPLECLQEACRNKNLLNKQKRALAEDIAGVSKKEIFGFKCGDAWENIFMRNLIIHTLSCMPTGVLSVEKEKCLIGKLTDKCNY
jgi:hypothetical protein